MTPHDRNPGAGDATDATADSLLHLEHGDLFVTQDGPPGAPALLLVHGSAASSRSWEALVPLLTPSHRVIRIDLPGHGRSAEPVGRGYETEHQAQALGAALDRLHVERVTVVGHSSGGYAATSLAEQRPELVAALVLVNTGPAMGAFIPPAATPTDAVPWPPSDDEIRRFASSGFRAGYVIPQAFVDELRGMSYRAVTTAMQASVAYLTERELPSRLTTLGKPVLVLFGDQDLRWRPSSAADYRIVPDASIEMLPGAGHTPILEEPRLTARSLLAFTATRTVRADEAG